MDCIENSCTGAEIAFTRAMLTHEVLTICGASISLVHKQYIIKLKWHLTDAVSTDGNLTSVRLERDCSTVPLQEVKRFEALFSQFLTLLETSK